MILGTAGHIDHGKSALVTALTGRATDRLAEERRRGITIDLSFVPLDLGRGGTAGVVDVPGHEDFVRTMVAGASGLDLALLVIAADEGFMPQTDEHLAVLEYLRVPAGIPVITKADLVDEEWLELVSLEIAERLAASPVPFDPPIAVSVVTGAGIDALRLRIAERAAALAPRASADLFRLPVDRAFSLPGVGTVVTGTAWSGRVGVGDEVALLPGGQRGRVRSVESFGQAVERSSAGARVAIGAAGFKRDEIRRGDTLVHAGQPWAPWSTLDVKVALHRSATRPITSGTRVRLHLGTDEIMARVATAGPIRPGFDGLARLRLERPALARAGDRFVLRSYSPVITIGGGRVLDPSPPVRSRAAPALAAADFGERLRAALGRRPAGVSSAELPLLLGLPASLALGAARGETLVREVNDRWVLAGEIDRIAGRALDRIRVHHRTHISDRGIPLETLRHELRAPQWQAEAALGDLASARRVRIADGVAALAGFTPRAEGGDAELDRVVDVLREANLCPPTVQELERQTGRAGLGALLRLAADRGQVQAVERDRWYAREALDRFSAALTEMGQIQAIVPAAVRDKLGISRKYLIPLLEWADSQGITVRVGDVRRLRQT